MNGKTRVIDARGLACPGPVVETRKALSEGGFELLEVVVDNAAARDNVSRYASYANAALESVEEKDGLFRLIIRPATPAPGMDARPLSPRPLPSAESAGLPSPSGAAGATVFVSSDCIGRGPEELGFRLMKAFIYALAEAEVPPRRMVFMNSGVKLACEGSDSLENLRRLEKGGTEILACGTCLDYYGLKESLGLGRVSNMYEIAGCLLDGRSLSI
jgi:selenium metabolism protein YedF